MHTYTHTFTCTYARIHTRAQGLEHAAASKGQEHSNEQHRMHAERGAVTLKIQTLRSEIKGSGERLQEATKLFSNVCVCMCMHVYVYVYVYMYTYVYIYVYVCMCIHISLSIHQTLSISMSMYDIDIDIDI